jgi:hypothetical protein
VALLGRTAGGLHRASCDISAIRQTAKEHFIQITAPISSGSSGGPVLNAEGVVIGIAVATVREGQNLNFAIPASYLVALLSKPQILRPIDEQLGWLGDPTVSQDPQGAEPEASVEALKGAALDGDLSAMHELGGLYYSGQGVIQSYFEAAKWWREAADGGHARAMESLATMYGMGYGVPQDSQQMLAWLRKAANLLLCSIEERLVYRRTQPRQPTGTGKPQRTEPRVPCGRLASCIFRAVG